MEKSYTLSLHNGGGKARQAHNRREPSALGHASDIDSTRTKNNLVFVDIPIRQAYTNIFADAVQEYNIRARADRQIKDYWATITANTKKHAAYELIVQIGSRAEGSPVAAVDALKRYVHGWSAANPNLYLTGAYLHVDEGTPHLHLDYIPVAECSRGMKLQNSLTGALKAQGFVTQSTRNTAQMQWEQSERDRMRSICRSMDIDLLEQGHGRKYMTIGEYKQYADALEQIKQQEHLEQTSVAMLMQAGQKAEQQAAEQIAQIKQRVRQEEQQAEQQIAQIQQNVKAWETKERQAEQQEMQACLQLDAKRRKAKEDLDTEQCKLFSVKQDIAEAQDTKQTMQRNIQKLQAEMESLQEEYKQVTAGVYRERTIALVRSDPHGAELWAWAANTAVMEHHADEFMQEEFRQDMETWQAWRQEEELEI